MILEQMGRLPYYAVLGSLGFIDKINVTEKSTSIRGSLTKDILIKDREWAEKVCKFYNKELKSQKEEDAKVVVVHLEMKDI